MRSLRLCAAALALAAPLVFAADFWQDKDPAQWSDKDAKKLLTKSPWAHDANVELASGSSAKRNTDSTATNERLPGTRPNTNMGGMGGGRGGRGGSGGMGGMGGMGGGSGQSRPKASSKTPPKVQVRWQSGQAMIDAALRHEDPDAKKLAEWSKECYVIVASAAPALGKNAKNADASKVRKAAERLQPISALQVKGKDPVQAVRTESYMSAEEPMVALLFPRSEVFMLEDKEVEFSTRMGSAIVKQKFALKDMVRKGKLEL